MQIIYMDGEYLSYSEFKWVKNDDNFDVNSSSKSSPYGYNLEVHLEYPNELHNLHNDYLLALEKVETTYDMLSNYCIKNAWQIQHKSWWCERISSKFK